MKIFLKYVFAVIFAVVTGYSVYASQKPDVMSELALANVEALASGEGGGWIGKIWLDGEYGTGGCIHCPEADSNCNC